MWCLDASISTCFTEKKFIRYVIRKFRGMQYLQIRVASLLKRNMKYEITKRAIMHNKTEEKAPGKQ